MIHAHTKKKLSRFTSKLMNNTVSTTYIVGGIIISLSKVLFVPN